MKILHLCDSIIGGTGTYMAELLPHQVARYGADRVALIMPSNHLRYVERTMLESGLRIISFPRPNRLAGMFFLTFVYLYHRMIFRPDVVHAHSFGAGIVSRMLHLGRRPFLLFCPHGWAFDMAGSRFKQRVIATLERFLAWRTDRLVLISNHEYQRALDIGIAREKLAVVPNGIASAPPQVEAAEWEDERLKILFVGRFDRQKGLDTLLEAVKPLGDRVTVRVIGEIVVSGGYDPRQQLPFVEYLNWRDRNGVAAQMKASDVLVVPSRWEGFGLVAVEAMRLSLPVVASNVGGLKEILESGRYGYSVPPDDAPALRDCLRRVTREELSAMRNVAYRRFSDHYTAERMCGQIDSLYEGLVQPHQARERLPI